MKIKFLVLSVFLSLAFIAAGCSLKPADQSSGSSNANNSATSSSSLILFYSLSCPHCQKVEQYMDENNIKEKLNPTMKEIYNDKAAAADLLNKAKICKLDTNNVGVPFLWSDGQCLIGDEDIINFFKSKTQ